MTDIALNFDRVRKSFGRHVALADFTLTVRAGELFGLVGVNGAGKTTLIKCLLDFATPDSGRIEIFGAPHVETSSRRPLAFLPERFLPPYYLTGRDFLKYMLALHRQRFVRERVGSSVALVVQRGNEQINTTMTPRVDPPPGQGAIGVKIQARTRPVAYNPLESIWLGFRRAVNVIAFTLAAPLMVIQGTMPGEMLRPIGLPGMAQVTSQAVEATRQS